MAISSWVLIIQPYLSFQSRVTNVGGWNQGRVLCRAMSWSCCYIPQFEIYDTSLERGFTSDLHVGMWLNPHLAFPACSSE